MANQWVAGALGGLGGLAQGMMMSKLLAARQGQPMTPTPEAGQIAPPVAPGNAAPGQFGPMTQTPLGPPGQSPGMMGGGSADYLIRALLARQQAGGTGGMP